MKPSAPDDLRVTMDRVLLALYAEQRTSGYTARVGIDTLAASAEVTPRLMEKIARFLEREGLLELDQYLVDLTVEGILRAEAIQRDGAPAGGSSDAEQAAREVGSDVADDAGREASTPSRERP